MITIKHLPPVAMANIFSLFRIAVLIVDVSFKKVYMLAFFGPEINSSNSAFSIKLWAVQYLLPIVVAWLIGLLFSIGYNAIVKALGKGLHIEFDD